MTSGMIKFLNENMGYETIAFNGDMYPDKENGNGRYIVEAFQKCKLRSVDELYDFVTKFDAKYYCYQKNTGEELIYPPRMLSEETLDMTNNWIDYVYVINQSGKNQYLKTRGGQIELQDRRMAIVHFQDVNKICDEIERYSANWESGKEALITKEKFIEIVDKLKAAHDLVDETNTLFRGYNERLEMDFLNGAGMIITHENEVVYLLELLMNDKYKDIEYFIYEKDFGRNHELGDVTENSVPIDFRSAGAVYDYLAGKLTI